MAKSYIVWFRIYVEIKYLTLMAQRLRGEKWEYTHNACCSMSEELQYFQCDIDEYTYCMIPFI